MFLILLRKYSYYLRSILLMLFGFENFPWMVRIFLRHPRSSATRLRLRRSGVLFHVRGAMDIWSVKEAWLDRFYEKYGTPIGDGWSIIDIGAGIGEFTVFAAHIHPDNRVYAFEPFPESLALLNENLRSNKLTNVQVYGEAIGAATGRLALSTAIGEPLQFSTTEAESGEHALKVPALSLSDAFLRLNLDHCHLLKLDCEGAEYEILFHAPDPILNRVDRIVMEVHDGVTAYNRQHMADFLIRKGFQVKLHTNDVHTDLGYLYACRQ